MLKSIPDSQLISQLRDIQAPTVPTQTGYRKSWMTPHNTRPPYPEGSLIDTVGGFRSRAACPGQGRIDKHRFLLIHTASQEIQSPLSEGYANLREAQALIEVVTELVPWARDTDTSTDEKSTS